MGLGVQRGSGVQRVKDEIESIFTKKKHHFFEQSPEFSTSLVETVITLSKSQLVTLSTLFIIDQADNQLGGSIR